MLPCIGVVFTIFLIPESPSWLIGKNRITEAKTSMRRIFGSCTDNSQVDSEIETLLRNTGRNIKMEKKSIGHQLTSKFQYILQPYTLRPLMLVLIYFFFQQFSGVFVIIFYALDIVKDAGITFDSYVTINVIALIRIGAAIVASIASRRFGRRPLSIVSGTCMTVCLLGLVVFLYYKENESIQSETFNLLPYIFIMLYFFTSCLGFLPVPFALSAEMFPTKIKGLASGLCSGVGYFFNFVAVKMYLPLVDQIGTKGVFGLYGLTALFGTLFLAWILPETRGRSVEEIQEYFGKQKQPEKYDQEHNLKEVL